MIMLDTNAVLRYILNDKEDMASKVEQVINNQEVLVTIEVIAETIYVLKRVYGVSKQDIVESILCFLEEVYVEEKDVLKLGTQKDGGVSSVFLWFI